MLCESRSNSQGTLPTAPSNHNRGSWILGTFGLTERLIQLIILSLEGCELIAKQSINHFNRFLESIHPLTHWKQVDTVGLSLLLIPAGTQPKFQAPARYDVQRSSHIGHQCGMTIRHTVHHAANPDTGRRLGQC